MSDLLISVCILVALSSSIARAVPSTTAPASVPREINADFRHIRGPRDRFYQRCVGSERAGVVLRSENQAQLELVRRELGFEFIRFHGLFHEDMNVYREVDGRPVYDWTRIDQLFDILRKLGMKPFVELSFMPRDLASGATTIFYWKGNVTPPRDYARWGELIEAFITHIEQRYGKEEVRSWYFEVWNEPNYPAFWAGTQADYFKLYDVTAAAIKKVDAACRVGGPASAGCGWVSELIDHCVAGKSPLDFISTHTYAVNSGALDEDGKADTTLSGDPNSISGDIRKVRKQIDSSALPKLPLHFTEWSTSYSSRDPIHDAYFSAAFILDRIKKSEGFVDSMSYWTYTDLFEENGPPPASFHGGFGLLNREGIRKAAYFAYRYLNELGGEELQTNDPCSWVCRQDADCTALLWNYTQPAQDRSNKPYFRAKHPPADVAPVILSLTGLSPGSYSLAIHRTGYEANDAYSAYIDLGLPKDLSPEQVRSLSQKASDAPEMEKTVVVGADGKFSATIRMRENDIVFISLRKLP